MLELGRKAHRLGAVIILLFVGTHLGAHLWAIRGPGAHANALGLFQSVYRNPLVEPLFILTLVSQIVSGTRRVMKRWQGSQKDLWSRAQIISGLYIAFFLLLHTTAALATRHFGGIETNFFWVAGTMILAPLKYAFAPYYSLAILAVFTHVAAVVHFGAGARWAWLKPALLVTGVLVAASMIMIFSGSLFPIELPEGHRTYFENVYGV